MSQSNAPGESTGTLDEEKVIARRPSLFKVIMLDDDYTHMDFVVHVLVSIFSKSRTDAEKIMLQIHHQGRALIGVYPLSIAETKVEQVHHYAKKYQYPLTCVLEKE